MPCLIIHKTLSKQCLSQLHQQCSCMEADLKGHEINLEDAFPIQFPFGTGGPNLGKKKKVEVSNEACLRH